MTRARGEGSIRRRTDGRWEGRYGTQDGRRKSVFEKTKTEVSRKLGKAIESAEKGPRS